MFSKDPFEEFRALLATPQVNLEGASLLDDYTFEKNGMVYNQKVFRLLDHSIYTETELVKEATVLSLEQQLKEAIANEKFERAAILRDKIKACKK